MAQFSVSYFVFPCFPFFFPFTPPLPFTGRPSLLLDGSLVVFVVGKVVWWALINRVVGFVFFFLVVLVGLVVLVVLVVGGPSSFQ